MAESPLFTGSVGYSGKICCRKELAKYCHGVCWNNWKARPGKGEESFNSAMQFAERFVSEEELCNAIAQFKSWHEITNHILADRPFDQGMRDIFSRWLGVQLRHRSDDVSVRGAIEKEVGTQRPLFCRLYKVVLSPL